MIDFNNNHIINYPNNRKEYWYSNKVFYVCGWKSNIYSFRQAQYLHFWEKIIFNVEKFYTTQINLSCEIDDIFKSYNSTTRNEIRKAEKLGINFKEIDTWEDLVIKVGGDIAESYGFVKNELGRGFLVYISCGIDGRTWYSLHIVVSRAKWMRLLISERNQYEDKNIVGYANRGLHHHIITLAKIRGYYVYDFGGIAKNTLDKKKNGINDFKMAFGGEEVIYFNVAPRNVIQKIANKLGLGFNMKNYFSSMNGLKLPNHAVITDDLMLEGIWKGTPSAGAYLMSYLEKLKKMLDFTQLNILDLGCSEGQALKMLYDLGCQRLGGVEIRKELYDVCQKNMIDFNIPAKLYNLDIRRLDLLSEFEVIYMYNPFSIDIMQEFIEKLLKLNKKYIFIYINSVHENYFFNLPKVEINVLDRAIDIWGNNILVFELKPNE
jgi:hypothetical protein